MSDLNVAAAELDSNINGLAEKVTQTIAEGEELKSAVAEAQSNVDSQSAELKEAAQALRDLVEAGKQTIDTAIAALYESIGDLGEEASEAREKIEGLLVEAQQELSDLQSQAISEIQPALEEVLQHVHEVHDGFSERIGSIQEELGGVVSDAHEFLASETVSHMNDLKSMVEQGHEAVHGYITGDLVPAIQSHVEDYLGNLSDIGGQLEQHFETAKSQFHENASSALQTMLEQFTQGNEQAQQFAQTIDGVMDMFKELIDVGGTTVATGKEVIQTGVETTNAGLMGVIDTLEELKEFFGRFSFISL
jgi:ABC-type transporter Mla subunit MlaD